MSKRGLLLCNLARQGFNAPSSEKQALSKEAHYEKSHKGCEVVPEQDKSKHNEKDFKVLQWLNDNQSTDYVEENTAQLIEKSDNVEEIINYANEGNITGETSQLGQNNTEAGSKETSEQVIKITDDAEETTKQLNEKTDTKQLKEKKDNVHEININYVKEGNTTGETSQSRKNNTEVGFESDGTDFSGTDIDTDKDFVPDKRRKRKIIPSSSSSSSSSSTSSSSSDSESTKSINLLNIPNQTNTQLLHAHVPPLIVQQIATQDSNNELNTKMTSQIVQQIATQDNESNTEMTSQFDCEFQNTPVATKAKKRAKNSAAWKQNKRKALKNSGQEHTSSTGKNIPAKKMGSPCTEKCLYSCSKIISDEHRQKLFEEYWKLGYLTRQRDFVASCITTLASEYRRLKSNPKFARKPNSCFHLTVNGDKVRVCKTFLVRTLAITPRFVRHIIDKRTDTGIVPPDKRGTLTKKRISTEIHESVRAHINSIPKIESHYLRAQTSRHYIDGQYTVAELHRLYCEERKANDKPCATYEFYNRVFNQEFNISFFTPKKDQCDQCVSYHNLSSAEQLKKEDEYKLHLKEKTLSREEKEADMKLLKEPGHDNLIIAIYDLQAVLPVPLGNSSAFFYKSKLNCYNFTVTDFKDKRTSCFFWHEGLGNRGVNEIGSCVYIFLEELAQKYPNCDVIFYSDNCCGQQKNKFMINLYYYAVNTLQINSIKHKFLIRGHTQSAADNAHSVIEKAVRRAKKSGPIYVPAQYCQLIRSAKKTGNPFYVKEMNFTDFYNLKSLTEDICLNVTKAKNGQAVKVTEISQLKFTKGSDVYYFKTSYEGDWIEVNRNQTVTRSTRVQQPHEVTLKQAYEDKIPLAARKKADIKNLIETNIIPKVYESTYNSIF